MFSLRSLRFGRKVGNTNLPSRRKEPYRMKSLFRKSNSMGEWETWTDFHKKYQSDVYRKSANNQYKSYSSSSSKKTAMKRCSTADGENGFFAKMMMDSSSHPQKTAQRRSSLGGPQSRRRRRASLGF